MCGYLSYELLSAPQPTGAAYTEHHMLDADRNQSCHSSRGSRGLSRLGSHGSLSHRTEFEFFGHDAQILLYGPFEARWRIDF